MNIQEWRDGVREHLDSLDTVINDRKTLKKLIEEYLSQFFDFDSWETNRDFSKIILKWDKNHSPVFKEDSNISELGMDWIITAGYDDEANRIVEIELYPWGVEEVDN